MYRHRSLPIKLTLNSLYCSKTVKNHLPLWVILLLPLLFAHPVSAEIFSNPFYRKSFAVLIAVENYKNSGWKKMITPLADARGLEKFLKSRDFIVDTFFDKDATKKSITTYFEDVLPKKCESRDRVVVFLSGQFYHRKVLDKTTSFLVPYNGKERRVGTMIPMKTIKNWCDALSARHVLFLVNGNWNNFPEEIVEKRFWKPRSKGYYSAVSGKKSRQIITAGYMGESFSESGPSGTPYSLFAGNLITGLMSGAADIDNDGMIGVSELAAYVKDIVYKDAQQYQKPVFGTLDGHVGGEMIFLLHEKTAEKNALAHTLSKVRGTVELTANVGGATIYVDRNPQKKKTEAGKPVPIKVGIGKHRIAISKDDYLDVSTDVFVSYEKTNHIKLSAKKDPTLEIGYMIPIKGGQYVMGITGLEYDAGPAHNVWLDDFYIGKYEVTNAEYMEFVKATNHSPPPCINDKFFKGPDKPVVCVSWHDAMDYCKWKSKVTGKYYRLPTEAEWEIAARGNTNRKFPWGNAPPHNGNTYRANYNPKEDGYACTAPVKTFENGQTPDKIFHMAGNVFEWCSDWYDNRYYAVSDYRNPTGPAESDDDLKVIRGGSWLFEEEGLYCTTRGKLSLGEKLSDVGFRVVMEPK